MITLTATGQEIISLYQGKALGSENWKWEEKVLGKPSGANRKVINVTNPTLTVYSPDHAHSNGSAVIICPGGAFHVLDIDNEGYNVAKPLLGKGFTAFVLKYRLLQLNPQNPFGGMAENIKDFKKFESIMYADAPLAISDGKSAIAFVKEHAKDYGIIRQK